MGNKYETRKDKEGHHEAIRSHLHLAPVQRKRVRMREHTECRAEQVNLVKDKTQENGLLAQAAKGQEHALGSGISSPATK
eukprot:scaffold142692_cov15-Tisochrysis_lutea.AAC.2